MLQILRDRHRPSELCGVVESSLLELRYSSAAQVRDQLRNRSFILSVSESDSLEDLSANRGTLNLEPILPDWISLLSLGNFVNELVTRPNGDQLVAIIDPSRLDSFRVASLASSYCQDKGVGTKVLTFGMRAIEPLYGPPVNESSLSVLFSIIDYVIRYRQFPNVEAIREHHFNNLRLMDQPNVEGKRRAWIGKDDNKYTVALYSSLRTLDRRGLIVRELKEGPRRQIQSIKPTENGILSIVFSDLLRKFSDAEEVLVSPEEEPLSEDEY